ncbi:HD-GYP domain-containing protein [Chitinilyticum piscinae]|uniref:HD-GYP domain-containing protein n=1 Tax=Chitinilyticum piscinae TaxID=2866724 RepID=A0A8J7K941_9NEIS|nr:HD-GYP domain-containing protein [Chitinilyticum piscinae]MBE9610618.1 HD-GYP domain-containing protein [Chitinilyticum piscinae]
MIKKIPVSELKPGMFIHDLNVGWMDHPFLRNQFPVTSDEDMGRILATGVREVYIDTEQGLDVGDHAPTQEEVKAGIEAEILQAASEPSAIIQVSFAEEVKRASRIHKQAHNVVKNVMRDVRLGQAVQMEAVEEVVEAITDSILRNAGALVGLSGIKDKDEYTFLHSVSVCTLMVTFAKSLGFPMELIKLAGVGGLLHDTGKMKVPNEILNKPGRLTDDEFAVMRSHPEEGWKILKDIPGIDEIALDITLHHHERMDGSGYPHKLPGAAISKMAQMAAVVDVYDAITSDRCYHKGMPAPEGLRKLWEWSKFHFNPELVQAFMRCVGIYPVGSLVKLESGRLAIVTEQNEGSLLQPVVKAVFSTKSNSYITPLEIDLAKPMGKGGADKITGHEDPARWKIDVARFMA